MSLFDLLKFLALFICEIGRHLPVRLEHDFVNAPASLPSNLPELHRCIVDDWCNLCDLLRRQV